MIFNDNNEVMDNVLNRAILVGISFDREEIPIKESMKELEELALAAGVEVLDMVVQNKEKIDSSFFIGKGKVDEVKMIATALDANTVIFNDELSPSQIRNLEERMELAIIDRTTLILDIFANRAKTKEGKLQVEMAQLKYRLPRLVGLGKSLSRTGGGIGTRGPGEQKLEIDRRRILSRINDIRKQIEEVKKNRETQRARRKKSNIPIVALVGYTNSGKSTLMNKLLEYSIEDSEGKAVYSEDMLFATLDTYHRKILLKDHKELILIDTVGFVSKLPHHLVQAFKATLEEVLEADLLLHIVDASNEHYEMQIKVTNDVLKELKANDKESLYVFNKIDKLEEGNVLTNGKDSINISALMGNGVEDLIEIIKSKVYKDIKKVNMVIPYDKGDIHSTLCDKANVFDTEYTNEGISFMVELGTIDLNRYKEYIINEEDQ